MRKDIIVELNDRLLAKKEKKKRSKTKQKKKKNNNQFIFKLLVAIINTI